MIEIVKYELSEDKKGLLAFHQVQHGLRYYHIHSNELTRLEIWIRDSLLGKKKGGKNNG